MAKDVQGVLRGNCTLCDCTTFISSKGIRCDYCDHGAAKHQNLSSPSPMPHPQQQLASRQWPAAAVAMDGDEDESDEMDRSGESFVKPTTVDQTLRSVSAFDLLLCGMYTT